MTIPVGLSISGVSCPVFEVEFIAEDATRSESSFLSEAINTAIDAGATVITLCDTAGTMLPSEFAKFIRDQYEATPNLHNVTLGVRCSNDISMADASAVIAVADIVAPSVVVSLAAIAVSKTGKAEVT